MRLKDGGVGAVCLWLDNLDMAEAGILRSTPYILSTEHCSKDRDAA